MEIPAIFIGRAAGSRLLRQRISWLVDTARDLSRQPDKSLGKDEKWLGRELARLVGLSDEWWRSNLAFYRDEAELQLDQLVSFDQFRAGAAGDDPAAALYHSYILHWKLCGHDDPECRFHQALVLYHSHRLPAKTTGKALLPKSFDRDEAEVEKEWIIFAEWWLDLAEENGWGVGGKRSRSRSPKKRSRVQVTAKEGQRGLGGVKREMFGDRNDSR